MRKDLKDIDQNLRNDVLEVQEEYADLFGLDLYDAELFFWGCIYEQLESALGNPYFVDSVIRDLIREVMGDDGIYECMRADLEEHRADELKEELTVDEQLADFGRMAKRVVVSGQTDRVNAMKRLLLLHVKATSGIQKVLGQLLREPRFHADYADFIPEWREDPENRNVIVEMVIGAVNKTLRAYKNKLKKAAAIAHTAMEIEIERGRGYGYR